MELLIRSQDKKQLLKVNDGLFIANGFTDIDDSFIGIKNVGHVGRYKTEKRALEILDEIQKIYSPRGIIKFDCLLNAEMMQQVKNQFEEDYIVGDKRLEKIELTDSYVYEMPQE